jgi:exonuclease SbcC
MKIEIVQLENIRSHVKSTVPFARGFNCLVGGVGCGKSSILYSVNFALFGEPIGRSFEYLLREGAERGRVTVQFVQNGKTYKISRGLKRKTKGISQDADELKLYENENLIASTKSEAVVEQIKTITGLDKELFSNIVWVRQERLKELLDIAPRERQKQLDELFGLSDYEAAWSNIAVYQRDYENEKSFYAKDSDIAGLEKLAAEHNRTVEEFSLVEIELQDGQKRLAIAKEAVEEADLRLQKLEQVRMANEELKRKEARIFAVLSSIEETVKSLTEKNHSKEAAVENLKQRLDNMETQASSIKTELSQTGFSPFQPADKVRQQIAALDDSISTLKGKREAALNSVEAEQKRVSSLSTEKENRCPLCMQPLSEEYKMDLMNRIREENSELNRTAIQLQSEIEELQKTRNKANSAFQNLQLLTPRIDDLKAKINEELQAITEFSKECEEKQKLEEETRLQLEAVRLEISSFDASELDAARTQSRLTFQKYSSLEAELKNLENRKKELAKRLDEVKERIDQAQQKIERMQKIEKIITAISGIREAYRSIQPRLRSEFVKVLRNFVQQVLDDLTGSEGSLLNILIDESYTPYMKSEGGVEREVANLSGGERTLIAFAYRLGLGQLIMQSRSGHGLSILLLDEPTESLGREDGSIDRLAEAISRFKAIEQIIAVTHSEAFAEKAEHVIRLEKEGNVSKVSIER